MKVKCKSDVQDRYTGEMYKANKEYELTKERAEEVVKAYNGRYFEYATYKAEVIETKEVGVKLTKPKRVKKSAK